MYAEGGIENAFIVKYDAQIMLKTYIDSVDFTLTPVYYQLSQAEREKLKKGKIEIKNFVKADTEKVTEIEQNSIAVNTLSKDEILKIISDKNYKIFVCKFDNVVVGFVIVQITDEVNIVSIAVEKDFRNFGIGTRLIKEVENFTKRKKFSTISLEVSESNITAYLLYKKCGFVVRRTRKNYYADNSNCFEMIKNV